MGEVQLLQVGEVLQVTESIVLGCQQILEEMVNIRTQVACINLAAVLLENPRPKTFEANLKEAHKFRRETCKVPQKAIPKYLQMLEAKDGSRGAR